MTRRVAERIAADGRIEALASARPPVLPGDDIVVVGRDREPRYPVFSTGMAPTEWADAVTFPSMTIRKVVAVQIVGLLVTAGAS